MSSEYRSRDHFLHVYTEDEESETKTIAVFHPEECRQVDYYYGNWPDGTGGYNCDIACHIREWGYDLHLKDVPVGFYIAQYWATPGGWAGPVPIDPDDGIELNRLEIDGSWLP